LVDDLRARHPEALERLLDEYGRLLQGVAFHILHSHADAEEVVIDTMVTAWERIGALRDPAALRPWLLRIATRHAFGRRRRTQPTHELFDVASVTGSGGDDPERVALAIALDGLPPRMRACLSLHYYAGLSVTETAAALGISPNTVKFAATTWTASDRTRRSSASWRHSSVMRSRATDFNWRLGHCQVPLMPGCSVRRGLRDLQLTSPEAERDVLSRRAVAVGEDDVALDRRFLALRDQVAATRNRGAVQELDALDGGVARRNHTEGSVDRDFTGERRLVWCGPRIAFRCGESRTAGGQEDQ
jgi:RNA polymerase sigma-70 factor (ECF subfamily)